MKLQELGARRRTEKILDVMSHRLGRDIQLESRQPRELGSMLERVRDLMREYRARPSYHLSERDPRYLELMMMEQALAARLDEVTMAASPKQRRALTTATGKLGTEQPMTPDEMQAVIDRLGAKTGTPITPGQAGESRGYRSRMISEGEIQEAQVVMAAQDLIDRIQGMVEDVSEMLYRDIPALTETVRNEIGVDQAQSYQQQASQALSTLLEAVQASRTGMETAQAVLTGQQLQVPGQVPDGTMPAADQGMAQDLARDLETDLDQDLDTAPDTASLGRERR